VAVAGIASHHRDRGESVSTVDSRDIPQLDPAAGIPAGEAKSGVRRRRRDYPRW
jgi:hypothetical protein